MSDAEQMRSADYEARFELLLEKFKRRFGATGLLPEVYGLLDEYAIVITKRLEGTTSSTETSLPLDAHDLAELIPALRHRVTELSLQARAAVDGSTQNLPRLKRIAERALRAEKLLSSVHDMLRAYGPREPDDASWPDTENL